MHFRTRPHTRNVTGVSPSLSKYSGFWLSVESNFAFSFGFALLRSVIGCQSSRHFLNQWEPNQNQSWFASTRFPALDVTWCACYEFWLVHWAVYVCCDWSTLVLVLRHATKKPNYMYMGNGFRDTYSLGFISFLSLRERGWLFKIVGVQEGGRFEKARGWNSGWESKEYFTATIKFLAHSLANFYRQWEYRRIAGTISERFVKIV